MLLCDLSILLPLSVSIVSLIITIDAIRSLNPMVLGLSYGEILLIIGATAALIGPKDLPIMARTVGRLAGRAIGYVQVARGHLDSVMQHTQFRQVNKELQDTLAQMEAIQHEIRTFSIMNPGALTRTLMKDPAQTNADAGSSQGNVVPPNFGEDTKPLATTKSQQQYIHPSFHSASSGSAELHSKATAFSRLAECQAPKFASSAQRSDIHTAEDKPGLLSVLPVSAESAGLLPARQGETTSSDVVLEALVEAEVARNAKEFFSQNQNQIKFE